MLRKGSMIWLKKIIGVILLLYVFNNFYTVDFISNMINLPYVQVIVMALAGYFLFISGRQN